MAPKPIGRYGRPAPARALPLADGGIVDPNSDPNAWRSDPNQGYQTPGGPTASPVQAQDESFNSNLRDTSTDLGDISGTNSRRSLEYLQEGQQLEDQAGQAAAGYGADYAAARDSANSQIGQLEQTPGYTPQEASQINVDYSKYNTSPDALNQRYLTSGEQQGILGNPNAPATKASDMSGAIYDTLGTTANKADTALGNESQLVGQDLVQEQSNLKQAVDPSKLGLSSHFSSNYEMTPAQQQDMVTAAGTTVGNRYRSAASDLERSAAAAGNTSPMAIAAARKDLEDSSAAQAGDAMTQARIDASNAAAQRLQTEEGMRLGSEQDIASREQQNATTIGQQAQSGIESLGQQGIAEADTQRQAGLQGVETGGEAAIAAGEYGDTAASQRAAELAGNRQQTTADIQNTQYQQGVQTGQLTSQGAQAVGNARRQGSQAAISDTQQQEQTGQQGQLTSQQQQIGAYGAKTGAANTAEGIATTATADTRGQGIGDKASSGVGSFIGGLEDGGVVGSDLSADDPMAQPNDPSAYADPNNGVDGASSPQPGFGTRLRNAVTDQMVGRYGSTGSTDPNPLRSMARNEVANGVGALVNKLEDGGVAGDSEPDTDPDDANSYPIDEPAPFRAMRRYGMTDPFEHPGQGNTNGVAELAGGAAYISKPTLALIGERAPEMVVPLHRTATTKLPASTLKTAAGAIPRYAGIGPKGPGDFSRPLKPMLGRLSAR